MWIVWEIQIIIETDIFCFIISSLGIHRILIAAKHWVDILSENSKQFFVCFFLAQYLPI